jgi:hypothetical protein
MKILLFILFSFFLSIGICYSQVTISNIQIASTIVSVDASTLNNPNSYTWSEVTNTKQGDTARVKYWINVGAMSQNKDFSIHYSFNFAFENLSFSAMLLATGRILGPNSDGYSINSITTSVGYSITKRYYLLAFYSGPGIIWSDYQGSPTSYSFNNFCINANIQAYFLPLKYLGLGLEFITNLNKEHSLNRLHLSINYIFN